LSVNTTFARIKMLSEFDTAEDAYRYYGLSYVECKISPTASLVPLQFKKNGHLGPWPT